MRERGRERERGNGFAQRHRGNRGGGTSPPLHREKNTSWYNIEMLRINWFYGLTFTDKKEQSLAIIIVARLFRSQSRKASVVL